MLLCCAGIYGNAFGKKISSCDEDHCVRGLVQTIFGKISVIVTLGGGGGVKAMTLRKIYCPQVLRNI